MAVTIDLGSGKRATLSSDSGSIRTAEQRANVSELMLHWPRYPGLTSGAIGYLRELGLAGSLSGDPVAALRAAIEDGRVSVSIDTPVVGGGAGGGIGTVERAGVAGSRDTLRELLQHGDGAVVGRDDPVLADDAFD